MCIGMISVHSSFIHKSESSEFYLRSLRSMCMAVSSLSVSVMLVSFLILLIVFNLGYF